MELGNLLFGNSRGEYPVDRDWQDMFISYLYEMGFDGYGYVKDEELEKYLVEVKGDFDKKIRFENDVFVVMPYYWGEDDKIAELPNFIYKPTCFELQWYKYPLRDSYMNQNITRDELEEILKKCKASLGK